MIKKAQLLVLAGFAAGSTFAQQAPARTQEDSVIAVYKKLAASGTDTEKKIAVQNINSHIEKGDEESMYFSYRLANALGRSSMGDSINKLIVTKFPKGTTAKRQEFRAFLQLKDSAVQVVVKGYKKFVEQFPETPGDMQYDFAKAQVANSYANSREYGKGQEWLKQIKNVAYRYEAEMRMLDIVLVNKDTTVAEKMMKATLQELRNMPSDSMSRGVKNSFTTYQFNYAVLLYQEHKNAEALSAISGIYDTIKMKSSVLEQNYAYILTANNRGKEALPILAELVKAGRSDKEMLDVLKNAYVQEKGTEERYDSYLVSLREIMSAKVREGLAKHKIAEAAASFSLLDLDGNTVTLESLKGKVVVLDFWATWCGPCKKSFPAMKRAVEKYVADPNVQFLFIDCAESMPDPSKAVRDYINGQHYPFKVLLDNKNTNVLGKYRVTGIPAKFVIDGNGTICFRLSGFDGAEDAAVEELSAMIEVARKQG